MSQAKLRDQLVREFKSYWSSSLPTTIDMGGERQRKTIKDSALLIDKLGLQVKLNIIDWFIAFILRDYRRIFSPSDEAGQLDNLSTRFAWFNRILKQFQHQQDLSNIWPIHWNIKSQLLAKFNDYTSQDIQIVLKNSNLNVDSLIEAIRITKDFESQMQKKLNLHFNDQGGFKSISLVYQNVFHVYISHQDKSLADLFTKFSDSSSHQFVEESSTASVLESSSELFLNYRQILSQCATLTNGKPIVDLSKLYSKWLKIYANDILKAQLIHGINSRRSLDSKVNYNEIKISGLIINTADYCLSTAIQLEEKLKEYVYIPFKGDISFEKEGEIFNSIISNCLQRCLHNFELGIETPLNDMSRIQWSQLGNSKKKSNNITSVSNPSQYVIDLSQCILNLSSNVTKSIDQRKYYRSFLDKAVSLSVALLTRNIVKSRPLSSLGVEQLLLDLQSFRQAFLDSMESPRETGSTTSAYARHVNRALIPLETLLKVVLAPSVPAEAFVQSYTTLIADSSSQNFQKVLEMKGLPKKDQSQIHEIFRAVTATESQSEKQSNSFLTELDMDPPNRPLIPVPTINNKSEGDNCSPADYNNNPNKADSKNISPAVPMFSDFKNFFLRK
ncbi:hypothetical protein E3P89_00150 [Wallemia ichthyophaga]|uniref:Vps53 N-terminal domain-containing protein n=1 Tax=Wallemia ichthyophaga TaxID=245174 RepID=A0A4T0IC19_WALIC|nr:hypothetical protein E3P95_00017 [Wallemia ichthyophaga]TIB06109.1 hypothetical protein E3P94_00017 [Wallemia ichthyophaga]TIB17369.1 hypothetical protein E3P90_00017 [Wallemia ichthyophaga]TIB18517.1 hypothetical protein E3P93_00017 [Wallemia ichthyophaga]TIB26323.1 hypothetical protein E3P89_00150 [Wallemia ichthyophaga]